MQTRKTIVRNIALHTCRLCEQTGIHINKELLTQQLLTKSTSEALTLAWNLVDKIESQFPDHNHDIAQTRLELHALQDESLLLELHTIYNQNAQLMLRVASLEKENKQLRTRPVRTSGNFQLFKAIDETSDHNPYSPYTSPEFAHRKISIG